MRIVRLGQSLVRDWQVTGGAEGTRVPSRVTSKLTVRDEKIYRAVIDKSLFQGWLSFDGVRVSMQYSAPRDQRFEQPKQLNDWTCAKVNCFRSP